MSYGVSVLNPKMNECNRCVNIAESYNQLPDCINCPKKQTVEVLQFVKSFWKSTAICKTNDGTFIEVSIDRLKNTTI